MVNMQMLAVGSGNSRSSILLDLLDQYYHDIIM